MVHGFIIYMVLVFYFPLGFFIVLDSPICGSWPMVRIVLTDNKFPNWKSCQLSGRTLVFRQFHLTETLGRVRFSFSCDNAFRHSFQFHSDVTFPIITTWASLWTLVLDKFHLELELFHIIFLPSIFRL